MMVKAKRHLMGNVWGGLQGDPMNHPIQGIILKVVLNEDGGLIHSEPIGTIAGTEFGKLVEVELDEATFNRLNKFVLPQSKE